MEPRISIVTLGVRDLSDATQFYRDGLGFPVVEEQDTIVFFELSDMQLALYPWELLAEDVGIESEGEGFRGSTLAHNVGSENDVDDIMEQAVAAGATEVKEPQEVFWGGYSGYFADLDDHLWEIAYNPHFEL